MVKAKKIILYFIALLPLIVTVFTLPLIDGKIPVHYGADGVADRWGSKYELLIMPLLLIVILAAIEVISFLYGRQKKSFSANNKALYAVEFFTVLLFGIMDIVLLFMSYHKARSIDSKLDFFRIVGTLFSIGWVIIGNFLPKCKRNYIIGLRISWTLDNDIVWQKTHRVLGIAMTAFGGISVLLCLAILKGIAAFIVPLAGLIAIVIPVIIYSYVIHKKYAGIPNDNEEKTE